MPFQFGHFPSKNSFLGQNFRVSQTHFPLFHSLLTAKYGNIRDEKRMQEKKEWARNFKFWRRKEGVCNFGRNASGKKFQFSALGLKVWAEKE